MKIRRSKEIDDRLHVGRLIEMLADSTFEFAMPVRDADQRGQMTARRAARNRDTTGVNAVLGLLGSQEADGRLDVMHLSRELRDRRQAVVNAGNGVALFEQRSQWHVCLRSRPPSTAMNPDDQQRRLAGCRCWQMQIEQQVEPINLCITEISEPPRFRCRSCRATR